MSPYVEVGYSVALGTLAVYAATLVLREKAAARRLRSPLGAPSQDSRPDGEYAPASSPASDQVDE